jgi:hypothetical protein
MTLFQPRIGLIELGRPPHAIVPVASHEMHQALIEERFRELPRRVAETPQQALRRDLHARAGLDPARDLIQPLPQQAVPFGMGNHRNHAGVLEAREDLRGVVHNQEFRKFNEQITLLIYGVFERMGDGIQNIVISQVEVTSRVKAWSIARGGRNLGQTLADALRLKNEHLIGVRREDQVRGSAGGGHVHHGHRFLKRGGTVIDAIQHMAVNVDQVLILAALAAFYYMRLQAMPSCCKLGPSKRKEGHMTGRECNLAAKCLIPLTITFGVFAQQGSQSDPNYIPQDHRPPLLFREDFKAPPKGVQETPVTQAYISNPALELRLYGPGGMYVQIDHTIPSQGRS